MYILYIEENYLLKSYWHRISIITPKVKFSKFYSRYNDLVCNLSVSLNEMLRCLFDSNCWKACTNCDEELSLNCFIDNLLWAGVTGRHGILTHLWHLIPPLNFQRSVLFNAHWICIFVPDVSDDFYFDIFDYCIIYVSLHLYRSLCWSTL